jgi:outer membrane protein assembly factor BamD (BamD/ComL family)
MTMHRASRAWLFSPVALVLALASGCAWDAWETITSPEEWHVFAPPEPPPPPADSLILRGDKLEPEKVPTVEKEAKAAAELAGAHELYRDGKYSDAQRIFHKVAENKKTPPTIAEEARYYEAESLRRQRAYPKAADTYNRMLNDFPSGAYREQAIQHMFEIADRWLDDTRTEMTQKNEVREGKRWFIWPDWFHFEKDKPFLDEEGRAVEKLEQVRYNDMTGPLADRALFLEGSVKMFRGDYKDAEHCYSQIVEMHRNSPLAPQALELAIITKQLSTGGPDYDARKLAEARRLIDVALRNYPDLIRDKSEFLNRQLASISFQQAAKDFNVAEFYRRTGHPCSAYFCYEVVRRRYPGTKYSDLATQRMNELRAKVEKENAKQMASGDQHGGTAPAGVMPATESGPPRELPSGLLNGR